MINNKKSFYPLVSVIIPVYNSEKYIEETILSVQNQQYKNFECIILNDGSTDGSSEIIKRRIADDARFSFFEQANKGLSASRNILMDKSSGKYIQFLDSDDVLSPNKILRQVEKFNESLHCLLSYTNFNFGEAEDIKKAHSNLDKLELKKDDEISDFIFRWETNLSIPPHSFLVDLNFIRENNIRFDENLKNHEDFDFWLELLYRKPLTIFLDEFLCTYRNTPNSMSKNMRLMGEGFLFVLDKHLNKKNSYQKVIKSKRRNVLVAYRRFDKMNSVDFLLKFKSVSRYYMKRAIHKMFKK